MHRSRFLRSMPRLAAPPSVLVTPHPDLPTLPPAPRGGGGPRPILERGGGSEVQGFVHQKWHKNRFSLENPMFPLRNFLTDRGGGGLVLTFLHKAAPTPLACVTLRPVGPSQGPEQPPTPFAIADDSGPLPVCPLYCRSPLQAQAEAVAQAPAPTTARGQAQARRASAIQKPRGRPQADGSNARPAGPYVPLLHRPLRRRWAWATVREEQG